MKTRDSILDINGNIKDFTFILSTKDYHHLGALQNVEYENNDVSGNLSRANELIFEVHKKIKKDSLNGTDEIIEPLWDEIVDHKTIFVPELNEYFSIKVQLDDTADSIKKKITGISLCESELSQVKIYGLEVNTEVDISRYDYVPTIFYNVGNSSASLLDRVFSFMPEYKIAYVDKSLCNIQRVFSVDEKPIYDWLMNECANEFHCLFLFDSTKREVYVYDLFTVCNDCGHRGEFIDSCPKCNSKNLKYFGEDIDIYIDKENLTDAIQLTIDADSIKNCFKLVAGDDVITSTVIMLNPNGSDFIYMPTDSQLAEMPIELREKILSYNELYNSLIDNYEGLVTELYNASDKISYYTHTMMPTIEKTEVTAQTEANKLISSNINSIGLSSLSSSTSQTTIESALKNYARIFIKTGYVKLDINSDEYKYMGTGLDGLNYAIWKGNFKITNYSDSQDIAYSDIITVKITEDYETFVEQKILKNIATNSNEEDFVFDVLNIKDLNSFKSALELYSLNRLKSFYDAIQSALDVLIELGHAKKGTDLYDSFYFPYYEKLIVCQEELDKRQKTIDEWQDKYDKALFEQQKKRKEMDFKIHLGEKLYSLFCLYRREETYRNDNYISDGLINSEIIARAKEFLEVARQELKKARTPKISITSTLYNLLLIPEFKQVVKKFKLGNWLRICVDDEIYRLMLIGYHLSGNSEETLSVEFANVSKFYTNEHITNEIFDKMENISSTYNYITNQASKGNSANEVVNGFVQDGLNSALIAIKNNNNNRVIVDKHGITISDYDDITEQESLERAIFTYNLFCYTTDGFETVRTALGKHNYYKFDKSKKLIRDTAYGLTSDFVTAGYIYGSQIIGGEIFSENYSSTKGTYFDLINGTFSLGGGSLTYDGTALKFNSPDIDAYVTTITKNTVTTEYVNALKVTAKDVVADWIYAGNIKADQIKTGSITSTDGTSTVINLDNGTFSIGKGALTWNGSTLNVNGTITTDNLTATGGQLANFTINNGFLYNGIGIGDANSCGISCGTSRGGSDDWIFWAGNGAYRVDINGKLTAGNVEITGGDIGGLRIYKNSIGNTYLETIPTTQYPLTAGIGNNNTWGFWAGYDYSTNKASLWITQDGKIHMRDWIYGTTYDSWAIWTCQNMNSNPVRYGVEYIYGDWDSENDAINMKIVFYDPSATDPDKKRFTFTLPLTGYVYGATGQ